MLMTDGVHLRICVVITICHDPTLVCHPLPVRWSALQFSMHSAAGQPSPWSDCTVWRASKLSRIVQLCLLCCAVVVVHAGRVLLLGLVVCSILCRAADKESQ